MGRGITLCVCRVCAVWGGVRVRWGGVGWGVGGGGTTAHAPYGRSVRPDPVQPSRINCTHHGHELIQVVAFQHALHGVAGAGVCAMREGERGWWVGGWGHARQGGWRVALA